MDDQEYLAILKRLRASEASLLEIASVLAENGSASNDLREPSRARLIEGIVQLANEAERAGRLEVDLTQARDALDRVTTSVSYRSVRLLADGIRRPRSLLGWPMRLVRLVRRKLFRGDRTIHAHGSPSVDPLPDFDWKDSGDDFAAEAVGTQELPRPSRPSTVAGMRIAAVCDRFTAVSLSPECECTFLTPDGWAEQIKVAEPHMLFVESAWQGLAGEWTDKVATAAPALADLVASCRKAGIPTVFWNKEDPLHFEAFIRTARLFDHVCTTDAASIPQYKRELDHERVHLLPFAVQPRLHHPILQPGEVRENASFFAGAWYRHQPERCRNFVDLADALALVGPLRIFDRNSDRKDAEATYPARYRPCLRDSVSYEQTPEIHRQHRIGLTLNTIKNSPTMFARRAVELMCSNTSVYSNHSRALQQLFGDLVLSTDDAERVLENAFREMTAPNSLQHRARRLAALRKVLLEYTWDERVRWLGELIGMRSHESHDPIVHVVSRVQDAAELDHLASMAASQVGVRTCLWVDAPSHIALPQHVRRLRGEDLALVPGQLLGSGLLAPWHPQDLYGPHYLQDLVLARKFMQGEVIGKAAFAKASSADPVRVFVDDEYRRVDALAIRRCLLPVPHWTGSLFDLLAGLETGIIEGGSLVSVDGLSYLENGAGMALPEAGHTSIDAGGALQALRTFAQRMPPSANAAQGEADGILKGVALVRLFRGGHIPAGLSASERRHRMELVSKLAPGKEDAIFSRKIDPAEIERNGEIRLCLDARPHQGYDFYVDALDASGRMLHRTRLPAQANIAITQHEETVAYRLAIAVRGAFVTHVDGLWLREMPADPVALLGGDRILIVVNGYPSGADLYRNAFVHQRVLSYRARGIAVDVVWVSIIERAWTYEFQGVSVVVCSPDALRSALRISKYRAIAVHFLDEEIWRGVSEAALDTRTVVWLHGAEIQPWSRRTCNITGELQLVAAQKTSDARMRFWRDLLSAPPAGLRLVFVSRMFAEDAWDDLGLRLPEQLWSVISNPIDTALFSYRAKASQQRLRVLSIRPHASRIYANDLVAATIELLSKQPDFGRLQFTLVGDGPLWEENFAGLERFSNVTLVRRFLRQEEIAQLHRTHGVFLVPSRGDTQGVSRDEAMASGLVPITTAVGAIPEFVDESCGFVCPPEDPVALASAIASLMNDPARFRVLSESAASRVAGTLAKAIIVPGELGALGFGRSSS